MKTIKNPREIPDGYVQMNEFDKKHHKMLRKAVKEEKIGSVSWAISKKRTLHFIHKGEAVSLIEERRRSRSLCPKEYAEQDKDPPIQTFYINPYSVERGIEQLFYLREKIDAVFENDMEVHRSLTKLFDRYNEHMQLIIERTENMNRAICILQLMIHGIVENLDIENQVFDRAKKGERIRMINKFLSKAEWDAGFESQPED